MTTTQNTASAERIGELAARIGLNPKTIRYYEEFGLLPPPVRTESGYRLYDSSDEARLRFIMKAKDIGLTLAEIRDILSVQAGGSPPCTYVVTLLEQKVAEIDRKLAALAEVRSELAALRTKAKHTRAAEAAVCGIIEAHEHLAHKGTQERR